MGRHAEPEVDQDDSDLPVFGDHRLAAFGKIDEPVISKKAGRFLYEQLEDRDCEAADFDVGGRIAAHFEEVAQGAGVGRDEDLGFGGIGQDAARCLACHLAPKGSVIDMAILFSQAVGQRAIRGLACLHGLEPDPMQLGVACDGIRLDKGAFGLIDEPLAQLRKTEPRAMRTSS